MTEDMSLLMASDSARRAADEINLHISALGEESHGKWVAIRLSDGSSDKVLYDSEASARGHQPHPSFCAYFAIPPFAQFITPAEAEARLTYFRSLADAGYRYESGAPSPIAPLISVAAVRGRSRLALPYRGEWT